MCPSSKTVVPFLQLFGPQIWDFYWISLFHPMVHSSVEPSDYFQTNFRI